MTDEEIIEIKWAWKLFKAIENMQQILMQKYHQQFISQMEKENMLKEMEVQLPF